MELKDKLLNRILGLMVFYLITTLLLKIIGFDVFGIDIQNEKVLKIFDYIDSTFILKIGIPSILCIFTTNIIYSVCIERYKEIWKWLNVYIVIYAFLSNLARSFNNIYAILVLILSSIILPFILAKNKIRVIYLFLLDSIFISISCTVKNISYICLSRNALITIIFQIDYYLMWIIYMFKKEVSKCLLPEQVLGFYQRTKQNYKKSLLKYNQKLTSEKKSKLNYKQKLIKLILKSKILLKNSVTPLATVLGVYFTFAYLTNKMLEGLLFIVPYVTLRCTLPKTFHADYIPNIKDDYISITCTALSSLLFCSALNNVAPFGLSLFSGIIVAFIIDWLMYVIKDNLDLKLENKVLKEYKDSRSVLSTETIRELFIKLRTPAKYRDYLFEVFINGMKDCDWFALEKNRELYLDEQQYRNAKCKFKNN